VYCCKWGTTLEQSASSRYSAAVFGSTNKAQQKFLFSSLNKTKLQYQGDVIKSPPAAILLRKAHAGWKNYFGFALFFFTQLF
jgi:hypothetical protein